MNGQEAFEYLKKGGKVRHVQYPPSKCYHQAFQSGQILKLRPTTVCTDEVLKWFTEEKWLKTGLAETWEVYDRN